MGASPTVTSVPVAGSAGAGTSGYVIPSAAYTSTQTSQVIPNTGGTQLLVHLNITVAGGGGETLTLSVLSDTPSGQTRTLLASTAKTATGLTTLKITPYIATSANAIAQDIVPASFYAKAAHSANASWTYTVEFELVP